MRKIEDKIIDILKKSELNEAVEYENLGGPTPSSTLKGPIDYAKNVRQATVPQAFPIPGVGEIGTDDAEENEPITDVVDDLEEEEEDSEEGDGDNDADDKKDIEETFASLLARLAEEDGDDDEDDEDDEKEKVEEDETSLMDDNGGEPEDTLPDVDSELENPEKLVTPAPGVKVAESQKFKKKLREDEAMYGETSKIPNPMGPQNDNGGDPEPALPGASINPLTRNPEALVTPAPGSKGPGSAFEQGEEGNEGDEEEKKEEGMKEDINAIFAGLKLSENAKTKASTIFKAAVARRVNEEKERVQRVATRKLKEAWEILKARSEKKVAVNEQKLTGQVDRYLNYVVENWMGENRLAVERGIRAELAESFIDGLKTLFVEHYIEVPENKVDVLEALGKKVGVLESKLNESIETNVKMRSSLNSYRKEEVLRAVSSGLADTQREKLNKLAEGVEYTTRKEFAEKLTSLKEAYFTKAPKPLKKEEQPLMESRQPKTDDMSVYTQTLTKMKRD